MTTCKGIDSISHTSRSTSTAQQPLVKEAAAKRQNRCSGYGAGSMGRRDSSRSRCSSRQQQKSALGSFTRYEYETVLVPEYIFKRCTYSKLARQGTLIYRCTRTSTSTAVHCKSHCCHMVLVGQRSFRLYNIYAEVCTGTAVVYYSTRLILAVF